MTVRRLPDTLWRNRLAPIDQLWKAARKGDPEGVHQLRVVSRRIREALPVLSEGHRPRRLKRVRRSMRTLTRTLGPVREHDVSLLLLTAIEKDHPEARSAIQVVREEVTAERKKLQSRLREHLDSVAPEELARKLTRATRHRQKAATGGHDRVKPEPTDTQWQVALATRVVRRSKRLQRSIEHAGSLYTQDRLHAVRVAVKKLRYVLELGKDARVAPWTAAIRSLKQMQDTLGELQDREALLARVRAVHAAQGQPAVSDSLDRLTRLLEEEARRYHAQFVSRREDLTELCAAVRQQASGILPMGRSLKRPAKASQRQASPSRRATVRASRR